MATVGILGAINIHYSIILGEFGIGVLSALLAKQVSRDTWTTTAWAGAAGGVGIFVCNAIAYGIINGLVPR